MPQLFQRMLAQQAAQDDQVRDEFAPTRLP